VRAADGDAARHEPTQRDAARRHSEAQRVLLGRVAGAILPRSPMRLAPQSKSFARSSKSLARTNKSRTRAEATKEAETAGRARRLARWSS